MTKSSVPEPDKLVVNELTEELGAPAKLCLVFPAKFVDGEVENALLGEKREDDELAEVDKHFTGEGKKVICCMYRFLGKNRVTCYYCTKKKRIFVILKPDLNTLRDIAESSGLDLILSEDALEKQMAEGWPLDGIEKITSTMIF